MDDEYKVYEVQLPGDIYGAVRRDADGFYSIYINNALSPSAKAETLDHELEHIRHNDHTNDRDIFFIESHNIA